MFARSRLQLLLFSSLFLFAPYNNGGLATAAWTDFTSTCTDVVLHASSTGHMTLLSASCLVDNDLNDTAAASAADTATSSTLHKSTLDLDLCLGIDYRSANLAWSIYGKFSASCAECRIVGRTGLGCACATLDGVHANSTIDLGK